MSGKLPQEKLLISIHVLRVEDDECARWKMSRWSYFNPRPPCGGRPAVGTASVKTAAFQSTSSVWRTTIFSSDFQAQRGISIHVLRVEDDGQRLDLAQKTVPFQSTSSVWRTTGVHHPLAALGLISIHVLRVEDDIVVAFFKRPTQYFNPRPPCGGRRHRYHMPDRQPEFQSTSSVWRTTGFKWHDSDTGDISIHVLRVEDDLLRWFVDFYGTGFQSTSSVWRTTCIICLIHNRRVISIHVLRVEDDSRANTLKVGHLNFNPRPPCGGRLKGIEEV